MSKARLDQTLEKRGIVSTRSQAESYIKLGYVKVNSKIITKSGFLVSADDEIQLTATEQYVSRAALKLASVADKLKLDFRNKIVLDVGSSTGGFTDYALKHGAKKVVAIEVGADQMHPSLRLSERVELHEKTDIRDVFFYSISEKRKQHPTVVFNLMPDIVLIDVSFISLREILPHLKRVLAPSVQIVAMLKPQFEAGAESVNKGVIKNDTLRRKILKEFEAWTKNSYKIIDKADSEVSGAKGNQERFYLLTSLK
jgi:23S rRNA (cytidine1920-2'-O)/16S rRNA (cytidine1409-2'-O)-methyltransferase